MNDKQVEKEDYLFIYTETVNLKNGIQPLVRETVRGPVWDPEKEPGAPAVAVNHRWEIRDPVTPCPVHVWLSR